MDFEQRVQEHNVDIAFIRDGIRGLPSEEEIREQASSGKYVWKKYELKVIRFKVTSSSNAREWWFSSDDIDFGTVTNEFFDGITFVANGVTITITPTEFSYGGNKSPYTWNPSSKHIVTQTNYVHADVNVEAEKEEKTFVAYVTNDSPTAYPDNGEKDRCWYETVKPFEQGVLVIETDSENYILDVVFKGKIAGHPYNPYGTSMALSRAKNILVDFDEIKDSGMRDVFNRINPAAKLKIKAEKIGKKAFSNIAYNSKAVGLKIWISGKTKDILGDTSYVYSPFYTLSNEVRLNIYCEASSKPAGWHDKWYLSSSSSSTTTVTWGVTESEFDAL